jgi:hypothetical protein
MTAKALSLIGFMPEASGMAFLRNNCVLPNRSTNAIREQWLIARSRVKTSATNAGQPKVSEIPSGHEDYLNQVVASPSFSETLEGMHWSFKLVEIDPLIAFQFHLWPDRAANLCKNLDAAPEIDDILPVCLPLDVEDIDASVSSSGSTVTIESKSMNLKFSPSLQEITVANPRRKRTIGLQFFPSCPLIQVVRFRGRSYLKNGYHRAYGLGRVGLESVPCIYLEGATSFSQVGLIADRTFQPGVLESEKPPTVGHFVQDRAYEVSMYEPRQVMSVTASHKVLRT